mmetsp:Transcript_17681/g.32694  ORF Transcript_17681/g.32694 Transcript_17681/m.32694 type:complete len:218 (-) Transcript_17681:1203-1856(-)
MRNYISGIVADQILEIDYTLETKITFDLTTSNVSNINIVFKALHGQRYLIYASLSARANRPIEIAWQCFRHTNLANSFAATLTECIEPPSIDVLDDYTLSHGVVVKVKMPKDYNLSSCTVSNLDFILRVVKSSTAILKHETVDRITDHFSIGTASQGVAARHTKLDIVRGEAQRHRLIERFAIFNPGALAPGGEKVETLFCDRASLVKESTGHLTGN